MKTVRQFIKIISIILSAVLIFSACSSKNDESFPYITLESNESTLVSEYVIIIDEYAASGITEAAGELALRILEATGVPTRVVHNGEYLALTEGSRRIIFGYSDCEESRRAFAELRSDDYICKYSGETLILGGRGNAATLYAYDRFCSEVLPVSTSELLVPEGYSFEYKSWYDTVEYRINGLSLTEFHIVAEGEALRVAEELQRGLAREYGYWLPILHEKSVGRAICIKAPSNSFSDGEAFIINSNGGIELCASSYVGLFALVDRLCSVDSENGCVSVTVNNRERIDYGHTEYSVGSLLLCNRVPISSASAFADVSAPVIYRLPDIAITDDNSVIGELQRNLEDYSSLGCALVKDTWEYVGRVQSDNAFAEGFEITSCFGRFRVIKISGSAHEAIDLDISELCRDGMPAVVLVHTLNGERITPSLANGEVKEIFTERELLGNDSYTFTVYTTDDRLSITDSGYRDCIFYREISVKIDY